MIGINWVLVMLGSISIAKYFVKNSLLTSLLTGLVSVVFDIILEPVAISLDYWQWSAVSPPLSNYCSWFIIVFLLTIIYTKMKLTLDLSLARFYLFVQTAFFLSLNVVL